MLESLQAYFVVLLGEIEFWAKLWDYRYSKDTAICDGTILCERRRYHKRNCQGATIKLDSYMRKVTQ